MINLIYACVKLLSMFISKLERGFHVEKSNKHVYGVLIKVVLHEIRSGLIRLEVIRRWLEVIRGN